MVTVAPRRPPHRSAAPAAVLLLATLLPVLLAGCGYHQDVPALPGGARSLSLDAIRNRTDVGELDVRLRAELVRRLALQAHVTVLPAADTELRLSIVLDEATVSRALDPALTQDRSFSYTLSGRMTLLDTRTGARPVDGERIAVSVTRLHDPAVLETPAVRDEAYGRLLADFAEQVQRRLLQSF